MSPLPDEKRFTNLSACERIIFAVEKFIDHKKTHEENPCREKQHYKLKHYKL